MCATEWIGVLDNWRRELCEEDDDDYWDTSYEIYFWTHEMTMALLLDPYEVAGLRACVRCSRGISSAARSLSDHRGAVLNVQHRR